MLTAEVEPTLDIDQGWVPLFSLKSTSAIVLQGCHLCRAD
jgi:hypothetical protein